METPAARRVRECAAIADRTCDRVEALDPALHAFVAEPARRERLRAEARTAAGRWQDPDAEPPLYGVPVGVKDIVHVDGLPTRAGSELPAQVLTGPQATLVSRLRAAGALVAGKTVTAEFAVSAPGPTRNPHHLGHTPGGSSSGSAAAVAAGMVPLAVGTQTAGSVIRPAAYCGVLGFKPTHGRIPADGVIPNAPTLDTVGLLAADAALLARAAGVLCDAWRPTTRTLPQLTLGGAPRPRLAVPDGPYLDRAGAEARDAFEEQTARLSAAGFAVRRVPFMADFEELVRQQFAVNRFEIARSHAAWFPRYEALYRPQTAAAIRQGQGVSAEAYADGLRERARFRERLGAVMTDAGVDLWLAPSATGPAPAGLESTGDAIMCMPWSFAGAPVLGLPAGRARANGLPLGLQCVARPGADERLLAWAPALAAVFG
ncbi:amidase [Streptomyces sp. P1-3]|uniref:amidase n=1 Tax=Streptomyces sp. P1-3 TaxID=3421658 RepID=UPI003D35F832